jgi:hypothetical protein
MSRPIIYASFAGRSIVNKRMNQHGCPKMKNGLIFFVALLIQFTPCPAFAGIEFCNNNERDVLFSIAYEEFDKNGASMGWLSRGWLRVNKGGCFEFDTQISVKEFYWRAETDWYDEGKGRGKLTWPGPDTAGRIFWNFDPTYQGNFQVYVADAAETLSATAHAKFNSYERSMRSKSGLYPRPSPSSRTGMC